MWGKEQQEAFEPLKMALVQTTAMAHPRSGFPFIIDCDAASQGLGAVLQQRDDLKREVPICFASRVLRSSERKWPSTELEAFVVVWSLETFRVYIEVPQLLCIQTIARCYGCATMWASPRDLLGGSCACRNLRSTCSIVLTGATLWLVRSHAAPLVSLSLNPMTPCSVAPCVLCPPGRALSGVLGTDAPISNKGRGMGAGVGPTGDE